MLSVAIFGVMAIVMHATSRSPEVMQLVYLFGSAQFFVSVNGTLSALLHAKGRVDGMSALASPQARVGRRSGRGHPGAQRLWGFAAAFLVSESIKTLGLFALSRRHLGVVLRVDRIATKAMILSSLRIF